MRIALAIAAFGLAALAQAQAPAMEGFDDPALDERYRELIYSLRCLQCQNQSIAESPADQAADIRALIRERIAAGQSNREIRDYLISRYGNFISYVPPLQPSTWLLWAAPALALVGGGIVFGFVLRNRSRQPLDEGLD